MTNLDKVKQAYEYELRTEADAETAKWATARAMFEANEAGASQREIADAVGVSKTFVQVRIALWSGYPTTDDRPTFSEAYNEVSGFDPDAAQKRTDFARTKRTLKENPEIVAQLDREEQRRIAQELDKSSLAEQNRREQASDEKRRDLFGDETVENLELAEKLRLTEYLLIKARGNLRGFVRDAGDLHIAYNLPDAWKESCLEWIKDLEGHLGMAKALLIEGDEIDWTAFEELLQKEGK